MADAHLAACAAAGLSLAAGRAEAAPGQWSFSLGPLPGIALADQLWVARHLLVRVAAGAGLVASVDALPVAVVGPTSGGGGAPQLAARLAAAARLGFAGNSAAFKFSTRSTRGGGGVGEGDAAPPPLAGPSTPPGFGEGGAGGGAGGRATAAAPLAEVCAAQEAAEAAPGPQRKPARPASWAAIEGVVARLRTTHAAHVLVYGPGAAARLALAGGRPDLAAGAVLADGACPTAPAAAAAIPPFTSGVEDRAASVRIPAAVAVHGRGHVEDRRPAGGADPYLVVSALLCSALAGTGAGPKNSAAAAAAAASPGPPLLEAFDESSAEDEVAAAAAAAGGGGAARSWEVEEEDEDDEMFDDDSESEEGGEGRQSADLFSDGGGVSQPQNDWPLDEEEGGDEGDSGPRRPPPTAPQGLRFAAATAVLTLPGTPSGASGFGRRT